MANETQDVATQRVAWDKARGLKPGEYDKMTPEQRAPLDAQPVARGAAPKGAIKPERLTEIQTYLADPNCQNESDARVVVPKLHAVAMELMASIAGAGWVAETADARKACFDTQIARRDWDLAHRLKPGEYESMDEERRAKLEGRSGTPLTDRVAASQAQREGRVPANQEAARAQWDREHGLAPGQYETLTPEQRKHLEQNPGQRLGDAPITY